MKTTDHTSACLYSCSWIVWSSPVHYRCWSFPTLSHHSPFSAISSHAALIYKKINDFYCIDSQLVVYIIPLHQTFPNNDGTDSQKVQIYSIRYRYKIKQDINAAFKFAMLNGLLLDNNSRQWRDDSAQNENSVIICSPSCCSKPVWLYYFLLWSIKEDILIFFFSIQWKLKGSNVVWTPKVCSCPAAERKSYLLNNKRVRKRWQIFVVFFGWTISLNVWKYVHDLSF